MENKKFLGNEYVTVVRYFDYAGTLKAAVKDYTGKVFVVNASELSHVRNTGDEGIAENVFEPVSKTEDDKVVTESPEKPSERPDPEPEVADPEQPVEADEFKTITAINTKTNEETELTTEDELVDFATEHELDLDVIDRVLAGEQKTHKGFEFK
jgi:hypothetical protein